MRRPSKGPVQGFQVLCRARTWSLVIGQARYWAVSTFKARRNKQKMPSVITAGTQGIILAPQAASSLPKSIWQGISGFTRACPCTAIVYFASSTAKSAFVYKQVLHGWLCRQRIANQKPLWLGSRGVNEWFLYRRNRACL